MSRFLSSMYSVERNFAPDMYQEAERYQKEKQRNTVISALVAIGETITI